MYLQYISELIDILPKIFIFIVPGYLFLIIKGYLLSIDEKNNQLLIFKSFIYSYIFINLYFFLIPVKYNISNPVNITLIILLSIILSFIISKIILSEWWINYVQKIGINKTHHKNIWDDIINPKKGPYIRLYLDNSNIFYEGKYKVYENEIDKENYFIGISNFKKYNIDNKKKVEDYSNDDKKWVVLNTNKVDRYELFF